MTLSEDYVDTPAKSAGVAKANQQFKAGDHKSAMETLKLADINVSFVSEIAPVGVEDGYRFDVSDVEAGPKATAKKK
jgi:hypothetical protein